jgi:hypothetical protein
LKHRTDSRSCAFCGIERVRLHADVTMLARLTLALDRTRAV